MDEVAGVSESGLIDRDRVRSKLDFIRTTVAAVHRRAEARRSLDTTASDRREDLLAAAKYGLQTAIQAMIDVAYHLSAKAAQRAPKDAYQAMEVLVERRVIPSAHAAVYRQMVGFRNRVVHGYEDVDEGVVWRMAEDPADFERFIADVCAFMNAGGVGPDPAQR